MMWRFLILFLLFPAFVQAQQPSRAVEAVRETIQSLPEVKAINHKYDSITKRVQTVKMRVTPPDSLNRLYKIEVGYQGGSRFQPHYYFFLDPDTDIIYVEDFEHGDRPTLSEWRRRQTDGYTAPADNDLPTPQPTDSLGTEPDEHTMNPPSSEPVNVYPQQR